MQDEDLAEKIVEVIKSHNLEYLEQSEIAAKAAQILKQDRARVYATITELFKDGTLTLTGHRKLALSETLGLHAGVLAGNARGFAFCRLDGSDEPDVFIPHVALKKALNRDRVLIKINDNGERKDGEVVRVLERYRDNLVGTLQISRSGLGFVKVDDDHNFADIVVDNVRKFKAKDGDKVVVRIEHFDSRDKNPVGKIVENLGVADSPKVAMMCIIRENNLYEEFDEEVLAAARKVPQTVGKESKANRVDFTKDRVVTIDGENTRDYDDAIGIVAHANGGFTLSVHIADVSHYVRHNSVLDKEALKRGTSVYFPDLVFPMLPRELSNGICSLNPKEERLTLSVIMEIDAKGNVVDHKICEGIIKTCERMTYTDVYAILQNDEKRCKKYAYLVEDFKNMERLHNILHRNRRRRGALDFDLPESEFVFDERGKVVDVKLHERNTAHMLIESFMLLTNEVVAEDVYNRLLPFVYRVHEQPDSEKMGAFFELASSFGVKIDGQKETVTPKSLQVVLTQVEGKEFANIINQTLLRSLQKARYSSKNLGHFGIAAKFYCHFTSPIRRYPDLIIHRIIKTLILRSHRREEEDLFKDFVDEASVQSSQREKLAEMAEREVDDLKKAEYMQDKIGEEFVGVVSGVTSFGVFVKLPNTVEGLCALENLPEDNYVLYEKQYKLKGAKYSFQLGQEVKVRAVAANLRKRQIDFQIVTQ